VTSKRHIAFGFSLALAGCGPDGRSIGDIAACPEQPLYTAVYDPETKTWTRYLVTESDASVPVSGSAAEDIAKAEGNCITGAGHAESIESSRKGSGGSGSGGSGSGGASRDAGAD
jgi:hypothetical protein